MSGLIRFGVSVSRDLLKKFDAVIRQKQYPTRSKAIEDLIRETIISEEIAHDNAVVVGAVNVVYDHHKRELLNKLIDVQHDFSDIILSSQHIHLDHHNCFEIIVVKGRKDRVVRLANLIQATKGVKNSSLRFVTTTEQHTS